MTDLQLVLNGRFFQRSLTGVERLAVELSHALRACLATTGIPTSFETAVPRGTDVDVQRLTPQGLEAPTTTIVGRLSGHAWEQTELAGFRPDAWLLNLCNTGPVTRRRQAVVICDAQMILHPESYSRAFRWWYRIILSLVSRRAAAVFTISEFSKAQLERHGLIPRGKAHVLRLGVDHLLAIEPDPAVFARHGLTDRPYILATGSLARHKNLITLVNAFTAAQIPGIDLVIAGGGQTKVHATAEFAVDDNIHLLGRVSDSELRALYGRALALACPSLSEGFGFTPLEAMAAGCPVIATTGGAVPEVCGDAALYADPLDLVQWHDALIRVVGDPELRADLSARGLAQSQLYRWRDTAQQMLTVLASLDHNIALAHRLVNSP